MGHGCNARPCWPMDLKAIWVMERIWGASRAPQPLGRIAQTAALRQAPAGWNLVSSFALCTHNIAVHFPWLYMAYACASQCMAACAAGVFTRHCC
jgi:hypothetical protein